MVREPDAWTRRTRWLAAVLVAVATLAACSDDGDAEPTAVTEAEATTSSAPVGGSTTAPPAATTPTSAGIACAGEPLGTEVDEASTVDADADGDGTDDVVTAFLGTDGWHLRVDLATGGVLDEVLPTAPLDLARALTALDLDGDGDDEVWLQVGTGAAATIVGLYAADACDLEPVLLDGRPVELAIGGTVTLLGGVTCGDGDVTQRTASSEDGTTYTTVDLTYELRDGSLERVGEEAGELQATDPELATYSDFGC